MIRRMTILCFAALPVALACSTSSGELTDAQRAEIEAEVRESHNAMVAAMTRLDVPGTGAFFDDNIIFAFQGEAWDHEGVVSALNDAFEPMAVRKMDNFDPIRFDVLGPDAVSVTYQNTLEVEYDGGWKDPPANAVATFVWVRTDAGWRILHGHMSRHRAVVEEE